MAVYTKVSESEIRDLVNNCYDVGEFVSYSEILEGVENSNFFVNTDSGKYILTLFEKRVDSSDLPFFFAFTRHLSEMSFAVPQVIANVKGEDFFEFKEKKAVLIEFVDGKAIAATDIMPQHCFEIGVISAELHMEASKFSLSRQNDLSMVGVGDILDAIPIPMSDSNKLTVTKEEFEEVKSYFSLVSAKLDNIIVSARDNELQKAVVHADLFPDNVFFIDDKVSAIIDFYFSCTDYVIYDLAITIVAWCFDYDKEFVFNQDKYERLLTGYQQVREISHIEQTILPLMMVRAAIRFFATRLYDVINTKKADFVVAKDPHEYLLKTRFLVEKFGNTILT